MKSWWMKKVLDTDAMILFAMPFMLQPGKSFKCAEMQPPRTENNRAAQVAHIINCSECISVTVTDIHPTLIHIPSDIVWKVVTQGLTELWETRECSQPTFNNLPLLNDNIPCSDGSHKIICGLGRNNKIESSSFTEVASEMAGLSQSILTLLIRLISYETYIYGYVNISWTKYRKNGIKFLKLIQSDDKIFKQLRSIAGLLAPLLRETSVELRDLEPQSVIDFRIAFYVKRSYNFRYTELAGRANEILDQAGLALLSFLKSLKEKHDFKLSLHAVLGSDYVREFADRNLVNNGEHYRVKDYINPTQPEYSFEQVGWGWGANPVDRD